MSGIFDQIINYSPPSLLLGTVTYKGTWSAATNTPTLDASPSSTTNGNYYVVSADGTQFSLAFNIGDWIISNGSSWEKVDNTDAVFSVFGRMGAVVGVSTDYSSVGITNTALGASNPSTVAATNITATGTVAASGAVTGSNLSGTNTGNQTIQLTGGVTGSGTGSFAATVVTNANLTGDVTSVGNATTLTNAPVIAKVLTGYSSGAGTVAATDSILTAIQKLNGNDATNANLTGVITSSGNATSIAAQTGTGTTFVTQASPTLTTPNLGTPSAGVLTNCTGTAAGLTAGAATLAADATTLATTRTIGGSNFDGSANVTSFPAAGAIGGTTPSTGAFTTLSATGAISSTGGRISNNFAATGVNSALFENTHATGYGPRFKGGTGAQYLLQIEDYAGTSYLNFRTDTGLAVTGAITSTVANNALILRSSGGNATNKISFGTSGEYSLINYDDTNGYMSIGQPSGRSYGVNIQTNGANVGVFTAAGLAVTGAISATASSGFTGGLHVQGVGYPTSGAGLELLYNAGGFSEIQSYDRTGSAWKSIHYGGLSHVFGVSGGTVLDVSSGAVSVTGTLSTSGLITATGLRSASNMTIQTNNANDDITLGVTGSSGYIILNGQATSIGIDNTATKITSKLTYGPVYEATEDNTDNVGRSSFNFIRGTTTVGQIVTNNTTCSYNSVSDYRLKDVAGPVVDSGTFIDSLQPKVGTWKSNGSPFVGFLAHEFAEVSPSSVVGEKDAVDEDGNPIYQSMQAGTAEVIANLVAETQSLRNRLAALESQ